MLSTLESLTEWACNCWGETFHSDDRRPFSHHPYLAPVLPAIPAGDWKNSARMVVATERLKRASKLVETENDGANKLVSVLLSMLSAEIRVPVDFAVVGGNGVQRWTRARARLVTNYAPTSVEWNTWLDTWYGIFTFKKDMNLSTGEDERTKRQVEVGSRPNFTKVNGRTFSGGVRSVAGWTSPEDGQTQAI